MKILARSELCRDCQGCTLACSLYHEGECSLSLARLVVAKDMARYEFHITVCRHCDPPECVAACPVDALSLVRRRHSDGALSLNDDGIAVLDDDACIRCGACADSCPYGAIFYHEAQDRYLKCDLCAGREGGPLCVQVCPVGALALAESEAEV
jgi:Fe-S-cluster-containing hydrogenase component 2